MLCESDPAAKRVLVQRFPSSELIEDVRDLTDVPQCDLVAAGIPCQDLSQAGKTKGINGKNSGLVARVLNGTLPSDRDIKRWLRQEGFSQRQAKGFVSKGYRGLAAHDPDADELCVRLSRLITTIRKAS